MPESVLSIRRNLTPNVHVYHTDPLYLKYTFTSQVYLNILFAPSYGTNKKWQGTFTLICVQKLEGRSTFFLRFLKDSLKCCFYTEKKSYYIFSHVVHCKSVAGFCFD